MNIYICKPNYKTQKKYT